jgi:hypothetical protein
MAHAQKPDFVFRRNGRVLTTHSIRQFLHYFRSCASPCAITFQLDSTARPSHFMSRFIVYTSFKGKRKGKVHPKTGHEVDVLLYSFFNLGTRWGGWSTPRSDRFTPGKTRYPLYKRLGGPQDRSGRVREILPPPGFDPQTVQPVQSRYTD